MSLDSLLILLALLVLLVLIAVDVRLFISLGRQGDERRRMIVGRASASSFFVAVAYLLFCVGENVYRGTVLGLSARALNPFAVLSVLAIVYSVLFFYYNRRYSA